MKHNCLLPAIAIVAAVAASTSVHAQTPALIPYQGRVQTGDPAVDFNGTGQFMFALVDETPIPFVQATATVTRAAGVQSLAGATFTVTNGGTGYATPPAVTVSAPQVGGGVQATVTATVSGGRVTGFTVGTAGSGYTANPTLTIAAPPVAGPTIIWNNNGPAPAAPVNAVNLNVDRGLYSVLLGDRSIANMAVIPPAVFTRPDLRLRVWFNGTQLSPDQRLAPTGYVSQLPSLSFGDTIANTKIALWEGGGLTYGMGIQSNQFRLHTGNQNARFSFLNGPDGAEKLTILGNGNVGIGDNAPNRARLVVAGSATSLANNIASYGFLDASGAHANGFPVAQQNSIYGEQTIWAGGYIIASSDERIKNIRGLSDTGSDLKTLRGIQVTDYDYKDTITKGAVPQKKVIAQQVEKVFPLAVSRQTDVVPDIFKKAPVKDGWISLKTDLKKGQRVRLTDDKTMAVHEVLEVKEDKFRTAFKPEGDEVFVYGREVNDFRTVDYDAIAMLNVSATQELARRLEAKDAEVLALQKENAALKAELATQASKDKAQDDQLAALAALLEKGAPVTNAKTAGVTTVSDKR